MLCRASRAWTRIPPHQTSPLRTTHQNRAAAPRLQQGHQEDLQHPTLRDFHHRGLRAQPRQLPPPNGPALPAAQASDPADGQHSGPGEQPEPELRQGRSLGAIQPLPAKQQQRRTGRQQRREGDETLPAQAGKQLLQPELRPEPGPAQQEAQRPRQQIVHSGCPPLGPTDRIACILPCFPPPYKNLKEGAAEIPLYRAAGAVLYYSV